MISLSPCVGQYTTQKSKTSQPKKKKRILVFYDPAGMRGTIGSKEGNAGNITKSGIYSEAFEAGLFI